MSWEIIGGPMKRSDWVMVALIVAMGLLGAGAIPLLMMILPGWVTG